MPVIVLIIYMYFTCNRACNPRFRPCAMHLKTHANANTHEKTTGTKRLRRGGEWQGPKRNKNTEEKEGAAKQNKNERARLLAARPFPRLTDDMTRDPESVVVD